MNTEQMEIGFDASLPRSSRRGVRRHQRARWWFGRMREVVNQALDWTSAPPARPQQTYLELAKGR